MQEFEAWLLADQVALAGATGSPVPKPPQIDAMKPGEAKERLDDVVSGSGDAHETRRQLAALCELDTVAKECASFARFLSDLRALRSSS